MMGMTNVRPPHRRRLRNYLIDPRYQRGMILMVVRIAVIVSLIDIGIFYFFGSEHVRTLLENTTLAPDVREEVLAQHRWIFWLLARSAGVMIALGVALTIVASHRTAGAMYSFRRTFREIRSGNLRSRIRLRRHDAFQETAEEFNALMDELVARIPEKSDAARPE